MAAHWYGVSEAEKEKIAQNALHLTKSGRMPEEPQMRGPVEDGGESNGEKEGEDGQLEEAGERV